MAIEYQTIHGGTGGGSGTVTSVALSMPAVFSVSGSPVTTAGTITSSLATQTANLVWAGPTTGAAAAPSFRSLVANDIPSLDAAKVTTGVFNIARLATGTPDGTKFLRDDGTLVTPSGGSPGGSTTEVQYNNAGAFGGATGFYYSSANQSLGLGTVGTSTSKFTITGNYSSTHTLSVTNTGSSGNGGAIFAQANGALHYAVQVSSSGYGVVSNATLHAGWFQRLYSTSSTYDNVINIEGQHSGAATTGFGAGVLFSGKSSSTANRQMASIGSQWSTATDASRGADIVFSTVHNASALTERLRIASSGFLTVNTITAETLTTNSNVVATFKLNSTGTPDAGFGSRTLWQLESGATGANDADALGLTVVWADATPSTRTADAVFSNASLGSLRETLRIHGTGRVTTDFRHAATTAPGDAFILKTNITTGTPGNNFGSTMLFQVQSSTTQNRDAAAIDVLWTTAADATRTSAFRFKTVNSAAALAVTATINPTALNLSTGVALQVNSTQVVTSRRTGWTAPTGTPTRTGFATGSATVTQVAEALKALIDDLITHGLIGA